MIKREASVGNHRSVAAGLTLTELLVVVAIIGILAAIASPVYLSQVQSARRVDAQTALLENAQFLQRVYTETGCFNPGPDRDCTSPNADAGIALPVTESPVDGNKKYYDHAVQGLTRTAFKLTATPKGPQQDDICGALTLDHLRQKKPSDSRCWRR
jgi:type IV pilus assembly protein PilE